MAKHTQEMEKQAGALNLHVNRRPGVSRPVDEGGPNDTEPAQIDAGGQRAPQAKTPQAHPTAQRGVGGRQPSRSADDMNGGRENAAPDPRHLSRRQPTTAAPATTNEIGRPPQ